VSLFSCQVDIFNLSNPFPSGNWKDDYSKNKKVFNNFFFTLLLIVVAMVPTLLQCLRDSFFLSRYMFITSSISTLKDKN